MLTVLSPAKTLDTNPLENVEFTLPRLTKETARLVKELQKKSARSLKKLMSISDNLAELNFERYQNFESHFSLENSKQALFAFQGDVYQGLEADSFSDAELLYSQKHLRILSGLYGLLRPLDLMQPYRLEMGTSLKVNTRKNLYEYWGRKITDLINEDLANTGNEFLLNLASQEYFKSVQAKHLNGELVNVHFKERRNGQLKVISFNAKKARGGMAKQIIQQQINHPKQLTDLIVDEYAFEASISDEKNLIFIK